MAKISGLAQSIWRFNFTPVNHLLFSLHPCHILNLNFKPWHTSSKIPFLLEISVLSTRFSTDSLRRVSTRNILKVSKLEVLTNLTTFHPVKTHLSTHRDHQFSVFTIHPYLSKAYLPCLPGQICSSFWPFLPHITVFFIHKTTFILLYTILYTPKPSTCSHKRKL